MKKIILFTLITLAFLQAEQIKSIQYRGLVHLSPKAANDITGLSIGKEINPKVASDAVLKLYKQGYFKDIYIDNNNGNVVVYVKEKPTIAKIKLEGIATNDEKPLNSVLGVKKGQMYDETTINMAKERIKQYFQVKGYFDTVTQVETESLHEDDSSLVVKFLINRGENITIKKVNLVGSDALDYDDVEPAVANKQREFMGWLWGRNDGAVKIFELPDDSNKIREEYLKRGYLDANVSTPFLNAHFDSYEADLTYYIQEGEQFKVRSINIEAPSELGLDTQEIQDDLKLQAGDRLNSSWVKKDVSTIEDIVADKGYAYASVQPQTTRIDEEHSVDINYVIIPNDQVYIRNVTISGNDRTVDRVIRRELFLTEGNLYNRTDLKDSKNALKRTGYFEDVEIKENRINKDQVDLEVVVKETSTGSITGGIGYGSSNGLLLNAGISDSNVFGSGYKGTINIDKSDDTLSGNIGLTNPRVYDTKYSLGGNLFANHYEWNDYEETNYGANMTVGRLIGRYTNISLTYQIEKSKIEGLDEFYRDAGYLNGSNIKSSLIPSISFNNTDDYYIPRSGVIASTSFEYAGLGGDIDFVKNRTNFNWYKGLEDYIDYDLIFRYKASFGYIWSDENDKLPINEKLFLGGIRSVRGFENRSITPKTAICNPISYSGTPINGCKTIDTGGKISFNNSAELSFPIINRIKMRGLVFFDYGMIGEDNLNEFKRYSTGVGIEWLTAVGPLQLIFAKPLNKEEGDDTNTFEFNIGKRF